MGWREVSTLDLCAQQLQMLGGSKGQAGKLGAPGGGKLAGLASSSALQLSRRSPSLSTKPPLPPLQAVTAAAGPRVQTGKTPAASVQVRPLSVRKL